MSNRPVRLKYLKPKMKIILCIFLLYITAVSVFGQSVELHGILGESVKFPAAVKKGGFLMYSSVTIGEVASSSFRTSRNEKYRDRLQWDSSTGFFSLSGLKMEDIGEYKVQNTDQNIAVFQLNVHTVSVFGIVGKSIEFPTKVETSGSLIHSSVTIGFVQGGELISLTHPEFKGRVQWNKSTGLFSLSGLRLEDSGVYTVENDGQKSVSFSLTVWNDDVPVSKPHITITHNEYPCTIVCTAERGTGAILSWYRGGEKKRYGSSDSLDAPYLKLPQTVETHGIYICEAGNSVSNETSDPLTVGAHCTAPSGSNIWMIVGIVFGFIAVAVISFLAGRCPCKRKDHTNAPSSEREDLKVIRGETA